VSLRVLEAQESAERHEGRSPMVVGELQMTRVVGWQRDDLERVARLKIYKKSAKAYGRVNSPTVDAVTIDPVVVGCR